MAGNIAHESCGTKSKTSPTRHRHDIPGWLWLLCWSYCWTQLETTRPGSSTFPRLLCRSDELGLQDSTDLHYWQLRRSLGWSGSAVQVESCILQNIMQQQRKVLTNWCWLRLLCCLTNESKFLSNQRYPLLTHNRDHYDGSPSPPPSPPPHTVVRHEEHQSLTNETNSYKIKETLYLHTIVITMMVHHPLSLPIPSPSGQTVFQR